LPALIAYRPAVRPGRAENSSATVELTPTRLHRNGLQYRQVNRLVEDSSPGTADPP